MNARGFRPYVEKDIRVAISTVTRVDPRITVGGLNEEVTVEATSAILQTTKADVSVA